MNINVAKVMFMGMALQMVPEAIEHVRKEKGELPEDQEVPLVVGRVKHLMRKRIQTLVDVLWATDFDEQLATTIKMLVD